MFPVVLAVTSGLLGSLLINRWLIGHVHRVTPVRRPSAGGVQVGIALKFLADGLVIIAAWIATQDLAVMLGALFGQAILGNIALIYRVHTALSPAGARGARGATSRRTAPPAPSRRAGGPRLETQFSGD